MKYCQSCNAVNYNDADRCRVCNAPFSASQQENTAPPTMPASPQTPPPPPSQQPQGQPIPGQQPYGYQPAPPQNPYATYQYRPPAPPPVKAPNHVVAGLLALFTGAFGGHKLYLKRNGQFVLYLLFCWTTIPFFVSILEGIRYFCLTDAQFQESYGPKRPANPNMPAPTTYYR